MIGISSAELKSGVLRRIQALKQENTRLPQRIRSELNNQPLSLVLGQLGEHHRLVHQQVFELAVEQVDGQDSLEQTRYALIMLGSGARGEQLLKSDQDHALIYEVLPSNVDNQVNWDHFYEHLGEVFAALLHEVGYPLCTGNVMMSNRRWRGTIASWNERIHQYKSFPDWDHIRFLLIAADSGFITGDKDLVDQLRRSVVESIADSPFICWKAADQGLADRVSGISLNGWRERIYEHGFSLKDKLYTPLVNSIRLWALSVKIENLSTEKRIDELLFKKIWTQELASEVRQAFHSVLYLRLMHQLMCALSGKTITDELDSSLLSERDKEELKLALRTVRKVLNLSARHFPLPR